jgi:hypothetical protein
MTTRLRPPTRRHGIGWAALLLVIVAGASTPESTSAQLTRADSAAVILGTATRFEQSGRADVAQALYQHLIQSFGGTAAADEARQRIAEVALDRVEGDGRVELQVFSTTFGLWLGIAVPAAFGADSGEAFGAGLLVGGPAGFFFSRALLRSREVSLGQARAISWGGLFGTWQGLGWGLVLDLDGEELVCGQFGCFVEESSENVWASMVAGGIAGIATGAIIARNPVRSGVASGAQMGSTWGTVWSVLAAGVVGEDDGDDILTTGLVTGGVGLFAGAALARGQGMSRSRVRLIDLGALAGLAAGFGVDLLLQPDGDAAVAGIPLAGSILGAILAYNGTRDRDRMPDMDDFVPDGSLLSWQDGRLSLQAPLPMPTLVPALDPNGRDAWRPGLSVALLRARF